MRNRLYRAAIVLAGAMIGVGGLATAANATGGSHGGGNTGNLPKCTVDSFDKKASFDLENGTAKITTTELNGCAAQDVTLVTYLTPDPKFAVPQYEFAHDTYHFEAGSKDVHTFTADLPDCNAQVDLFLGTPADIINPLVEGGERYGSGPKGNRLIKSWNGGSSKCVQPAVQYSANCDGTTVLNLSNNGALSAYAVDFTVKYGSETKTVTVGKGAAESLTVPAGSGTITVSADRLETQTITWTRPDTCLPTAAAANDCTDVTVTVTNPKSNTPVSAEVAYNGSTKTVSVAAGESQNVTFPSADVSTATVKFPGTDIAELDVPVTVGECSTPSPSTSVSPSTSPSASPSVSTSTSGGVTSPSASVSTTPVALAFTGSNSSTIGGIAVALVVAGGVVFWLARRRKVNFTA